MAGEKFTLELRCSFGTTSPSKQAGQTFHAKQEPMDWYYSVGGEQKGPVSEADFQRLVQDGIVTSQTLVWRPGMTQWQPYSATGSAGVISELGQPPASGVTCASCGNRFSSSDVVSLEGRAYCATCKPMVAQRLREGLTMDSAAEETRKKHLSHESSVRSVGVLYLIGGTGLLLIGLGWVFTASAGRNAVEGFLLGAVFLVLGGMQFWVGLAIRRLKSWSRIPTGILSGIGLLGFPIGTIINGYILYLVFCEKGKMVFSDEYRAVIQQTPHIKQRTSIVVWIILGLLLVILGFVILGAVLGQR